MVRVFLVPTMIGDDSHVAQLVFQLIKQFCEKIFSCYLSPKQKNLTICEKHEWDLEALWNI